MKKFFKVFGWLMLLALAGIQFARPEKNIQAGTSANHINTIFPVPSDVQPILEKACYDCHSNNSRYPWYFNIQPVGMWMDKHIDDGKKELNFSEFADKRLRFQYRKMEEIIEQVKEKEMPIDSYTWTHKDARLTDEERIKITGWAQSIMHHLEARYPIDSLKRKQP